MGSYAMAPSHDMQQLQQHYSTYGAIEEDLTELPPVTDFFHLSVGDVSSEFHYIIYHLTAEI